MNTGTTLYERRALRHFLPACLVFILMLGLLWQDSTPLFQGLSQIVRSPDILINDYLATGGVRAAFMNAALVGMVGYVLLMLTRTPISGPAIAAVFTMTGFSLFGKNIVNIGPIIMGVYLYSLFRREPFRHHILVALFGTALAPIVSQFAFGYGFGLPAGILVGVAAGFLLPGLSKHLLHNHNGFLLYNVGFTAGLVGTLISSQMRGYGISHDPVIIWSTEHHSALLIVFGLFFFLLTTVGLLLNGRRSHGVLSLMTYPGALVTDFVTLKGFAVTLINMGVMGLIGLLYIVAVGGSLNGPTLGGLLTIAGFASFGKHPRNSIPVMLGVYLGTLLKVFNAAEPGPLLAALFATGIAPVAGAYGPYFGIVAGYLHLSMAMHVGWLHGGLNLYNNGFAGGLVATIMVALAKSLTAERERERAYYRE